LERDKIAYCRYGTTFSHSLGLIRTDFGLTADVRLAGDSGNAGPLLSGQADVGESRQIIL